jgi:dihydrofolate reductase
MSRVLVINHLSLDGVMQAPGRPDEDTRGGFEHGGWAVPNNDDVMFGVLGESMAAGGPLLFGRRTYEDFYGFWPHQTDNPFTAALDRAQKYVASSTLSDPLPWSNSTLLSGDVPGEVARLKEAPGPDICILGSGGLIRSLVPHGLIDRYILMVHPLVLGSGQRMFAHDGAYAQLRLTHSVTTTKGVVIATYDAA